MKVLDIANPCDVILDSQLQIDTIANINRDLLKGYNKCDIPISYKLLEYIQLTYSDKWTITHKEYKDTIKIVFKPKANLVELES